MKRRYQTRNELKNLMSCALTAALLMSAVPWTSALAADAFTDKNGLHWIPTGRVDYSDGPMTEPVEGAEAYRAESALIEMPVEELKAMYQPVMEIDGIQYTLSAKQAEEFASKMSQMILESGLVSTEQQSQEAGSSESDTGADQDPSASDEAFEPLSIIGTDERYAINHHAHRQPYARIAKTWSANSVCTAFKGYNHHTALTAAHCVHDGPGGGWRTRHQIQFAAGSRV